MKILITLLCWLFWLLIIGIIIIAAWYAVFVVVPIFFMICLIYVVIQILGGAGLFFVSSVCSKKIMKMMVN